MSAHNDHAAESPLPTVEQLAEEFLTRVRAGEHPSLTEYATRYPHLADEIRDLFPAIATLEAARPESLGAPPASLASEPEIDRLGDFQIIRELGRGGMGIVFEAEQVSLGRRVALKVLPRQAFLNARQRRRFEREARAAARLHHTNIVPVFGVGEHDGLCYYVMQLIVGHGLNEVIRALRGMRGLAGETKTLLADRPDRPTGSQEPLAVSYTARTAEGLARSLLSDRFRPVAGESGPPVEPQDPSPSSGATTATVSSREAVGESTAVESGGASESTWGATFWHSVARLGGAAGRALQYAHEQGVIHRDVKPANLLLDTRGEVWVTDFGLAKESDQHDLTHTGDVVGTLRYLAPERFNGAADARSDVYALGLTLYELLVQRPAFPQPERHRLIRDISEGAFVPLRVLDPRIPLDLETIVHKATDREPHQRYQSAADLADDLERFFRDEPIRARPLTVPARTVRWCRRNPVVAALTATVLSLAVALIVLLVVSQHEAAQQRDQFREALVQSLVSQAQFRRLSQRVGHRAESLRSLASAAALSPSPEQRDEAIRCLSLTDIEPVANWHAPFASAQLDSIDFDPGLQHYVAYGEGVIEIRKVPATSTEPAAIARRLPAPPGVPQVARFSPDGKLLAVRFEAEEHSRLYVYDWDRGTEVLAVDDVFDRAFAVNTTGQRLALGLRQNGERLIRVYSLPEGGVICEWKVSAAPFEIRFEDAGERLAVSLPDAWEVRVCDSSSGDTLQVIECGEDIYPVAWSPDGQALAIGNGFDVTLTWLAEPDEPRMVLTGHRWMVHDVRFHPSGDYLLSHSLREGQSRLWDLRTQRCILSTPGNSLGFSGDGQRLALRHVNSLATLRLEGDREYQMLASNSGAEPDAWRAVFHPREPVVVEAGRDGIRCWNLRNRRLIGSTAPEAVFTICFQPGSEDLLTAGSAGILRRKLRISPDGSSAQFETAEPLQFPGTAIDCRRPALALHVTPDGRHALVRFLDESRFHHVSWPAGQTRSLACDSRARFWAISPDGRWAVSGNYKAPGFCVWNLQDETPEGVPLEAPQVSAGQISFSPDGACLVACANDRFLVYETGTWKRLDEIPRQSTVEGACAFSDDGRFLAVTANTREVELREAATRKLLARLDSDVDTINVLTMQFAPDNSANLCLACGPSGVRLWDLEAVHQVLSRMRLGW